MKLVSLNTWGGRVFEPLMEFIKSQAETTDIFCFQELYFSPFPHHKMFDIRPDLAWQIKKILPDFSFSEYLSDEYARIYAYRFGETEKPKSTPFLKDIRIGTAIFVKKTIEIIDEDGFRIFIKDDEAIAEDIMPSTGSFQYVLIGAGQERYTIGNLHGIWVRGTKGDTPKRFEQERFLEEFIKKQEGKKILCGDFNLEPNTKSIALLENHMRNLIREYKIQKTRSSYYNDMEKYKDYVSDYIFVSRDVGVENFRVLENEVSDHLPLSLEFF